MQQASAFAKKLKKEYFKFKENEKGSDKKR